ncbi:hypothetical protein ACX0G9_26875 [Flavitalea flava]
MASKKKAVKKAPVKKAATKKAPARKAAVKKSATKAKGVIAPTPAVATLLRKLQIQLGSKTIKFTARDIAQASSCLKRTGVIKIQFKGVSIINEPPDGGTPPGPVD